MESIMVLEYWFKLMGLHMRVNFIKAWRTEKEYSKLLNMFIKVILKMIRKMAKVVFVSIMDANL